MHITLAYRATRSAPLRAGSVFCRQPAPLTLGGLHNAGVLSRPLVDPSEHLVCPAMNLEICRFSPSEFVLTS